MTYEEFKTQIKSIMTIKQFFAMMDMHPNTANNWKTKGEVPVWAEYALKALQVRDMTAAATDNELFAAMRAAVAEGKQKWAQALLARLLITPLRESAQTYYIDAFGDDFWLAQIDVEDARICPGLNQPCVGTGGYQKYWEMIPDAILTHGAPFDALTVTCTKAVPFHELPGNERMWRKASSGSTRNTTVTLSFWQLHKRHQIAILRDGLIPWLEKYNLEINPTS